MTPMHLDEEQVQRLLHGELTSPAEDSLRSHLATCLDCRSRLAEAARDEEELNALLRHVDHPPPPVEAEALVARARGHGLGTGRRAAGILLALGAAGAAYAAPGSPLPGWVAGIVDWVAGPPERTASPPPAPVAEPGAAGIAVAAGQRFVILFSAHQTDGLASVTLTGESALVVRAPNGAAAFTSDVDQLVIENEGSSADFQIHIPRDAPWVEIRVAGRRVFWKHGSQIVTEGRVDAQGRHLLPLTRPGP